MKSVFQCLILILIFKMIKEMKLLNMLQKSMDKNMLDKLLLLLPMGLRLL